MLLLSCFRLAHIHLLWADEDYHLAAAIQILHGKIPYRDFWYDKPPLSAVYYLLIGGYAGWPLRLLDAAYIIASCAVAYRFAREWWGEAEAVAATLLLAFYTTFYLPSAVIPFAADAVMLLPHLAAVYCAYRGKPLIAGALCGVAFFANPKALFVLAVCCLWLMTIGRSARPPQGASLPHKAALLSIGFIAVAAVGFGWLWATGALPGYWEQVWAWGFRYAAGAPVEHPLQNGFTRTLNWAGFHAALIAGAFVGVRRSRGPERWRLLMWILLSFAAVALGSRFAPHYFLQLLPALAIPAGAGIVFALRAHPRLTAALLTIALLVPIVRFGPRYILLSIDLLENRAPQWKDVAMDLDSQRVASFINARKRANDTLLVWGYRPDVYVYTRLVSDSRFWDSQPLTGVAADRHLSATTAIYSGPAQRNREALAKSQPDWIVDGLGLLNPRLKLSVYPELQSWFAGYELVGRTQLSLIYHRKF